MNKQTPSDPSITQSKEQHRVKVLRQYALLDTPPEQEFDDLAALAAHICGAPIALISLVDENRQWFKSKVGFDRPETPREDSFCAHALDEPNLLIVPDALNDLRFANNPLVTGAPGIRFYAGAPLISPKEATLGTLCVLDRVPRHLNAAQEWAMQSLASRVMSRLEERRLRKTATRPGIHDLKLDELRSLVATTPSRCAMWGRLASFLSLPILSNEFSSLFVEGEFISNTPYPKGIEIILEPIEPYGPAAYAAINRYLDIGLQKIFDLHSVRLSFWIRDAPTRLVDTETAFLKNPHASAASEANGVVRIDLRDPDIVQQFHDSLDPYRT